MQHNRVLLNAPAMSFASTAQYKLPLLLLILLLISSNHNRFATVDASTDAGDVAALLALKQSWNGKPSSWSSDTDPCDDNWIGITCNGTRVTRVILINRNLEGTLSPAVGNLTELQHFDVSSNSNLGGSLPNEIGNLRKIERLFVQFCNFNGSIPIAIGNMTTIEYFGFANNSFTGPIPETVGYLQNITWFDVSYNRLNGSLPMSGTTSTGVGLDNLTHAEHLHLQGNQFSGKIPDFPKGMHLLHLLLAENQFTGGIPESISNFEHLDIIRLDSNHLTGPIPNSVTLIANLTTLNLSRNSLTGEVPSFTNSKLSILILANNQLNGTLNLTYATSLTLVDVSNNNFTEILPVSNNYTVYGNPYCNGKDTIQCTEATPTSTPAASNSPTSNFSLAQCSVCKDKEYRVNPSGYSGCLCTRPIVATWSYYALKVADLASINSVSMVDEFISLWKGVDLANGIKLETEQVSIDVISQDAMNISVFPPNGLSLWDLKNATTIQYVLNSQAIWFEDKGPMSCSFGGSEYGATVVVYELSLAAKIGIGIGAAVAAIIISVLVYYVVLLTRRVKQVEQLNRPFAAWIAAADGQEVHNAVPQLKGARWFSLAEIQKYTNNFSRNNEIGAGGYGKVYKGYLPSGECVAVKRSSATSLQGAAEFKTEIELLSRVHHRNLVGLIGFCFEEGEQMLVYPFMPNGTLRDCLSGKTGVQMTWDRRVDLALGAARGLAYLHNEANPTIIHRDIKSQNILLDDKLVAMVADFGLSKLVDSDDDQADSVNVKGTLGYLDPNYYLTNQFTEKSDVYSFGVVLLEIVTSRLPIQGGKYIVREVETALRKGGMDLVKETLVDPGVVSNATKDLKRFFDLALSCVQDDPIERPTMNEVVKELEDITQLFPSMKPMNMEVKKDPTGKDKERADFYKTAFSFVDEGGNSSSFAYSGNYDSIMHPIYPK